MKHKFIKIVVSLFLILLAFNAGLMILLGTDVVQGNKVYAETNISSVSITTGANCTFIVMNDGTVKAWGANFNGQLGIGNTNDHYYAPQTIPGLTGVKQIVSGGSSFFAFMNDGTVKSWGSNEYGQLGISGDKIISTPQTIPELSGVIQIAAGSTHTLALLSDGTVKAWGSNAYGQLGISEYSYNYAYHNIPQTILGLTEVKKIYAGGFSSYALMSDGTLKAWGSNAEGALGIGQYSNSYYTPIPTNITELSGVKQIFGGNTLFALLNNGTVKAWGSNNYGQVGLGNTGSYNSPVIIPSLEGVKQIVAGSLYCLALKNDGKVYSWGNNNYGQLGQGNTSNTSQYLVPTEISCLSNVCALATSSCGSQHSFAIMDDGTLRGWGQNYYGECGTYDLTNRIISPTKFYGLAYDKAPSLIVNSPLNSQVANSDVTLSISVTDPDNSLLMCTYWLDSEAVPRETKMVTGNSTAQTLLFSNLDTSKLSEGKHTIKFIADDGLFNSSCSIDIFVDRSAPELQDISITTADKYITVLGKSKDAVSGFGELHRYTLGNEISDWLSPTVSFTNVTPLIPNTKFTIKFEAKDGAGNTASVTKDVYTKSEIPELSLKSLSESSLNIEISDFNPSSTYYQIKSGDSYVTSAGEFTSIPTWITLTDKKITISSLDIGTNYTFQVKARNIENIETEYSNIASCSTLTKISSVPQNIKLIPEENFIKLTWDTVGNATGYDVEEDGNIIDNGDSTSFESSFEPGIEHNFRVRAKNGAGPGDWSAVVTGMAKFILPHTPKNIILTPAGTSISISWDTMPDATGYQIEADGQIINLGAKTTYTHLPLKLQTQHTYRVRSKNVEGVSEWSSLQTIMTTAGIPGKPSNLKCTVANTTATINWDAAADAETYEIVEIVNGQDGYIVDNGTPTTCEKRGLAPSSTHTYKIRAVNSIGESEWSDSITIATFLLDTPQNITTVKSDTSLVFKWDAVKNVDHYEILINGQMPIASVTNTYTCTNLTPETQYIYKVKAVSLQGESSWSEEKTTYTLPIKPAIPENVNATVSDTLITITWQKVESANGYDVELDGIVMEDDDNTVYIHDGLESDTIHTYRVRARNSAIAGDWSEVQYIKTLPGKPVIPKDIVIQSTTTGATLSWTGKDSDTGYDIKIFDGTTTSEMDNIDDTTYTHCRTSLDQEYTYWIRTRNKEGVSDWSGKIINNAIKAKCTKNKTVDLGLTAKDITDFSVYTMVVTYNASAVDVIDLSTLTGQYETTGGKIKGTDIEITDFTPGKITFKCDKVVNPGEAWTGVINSIKFKARATGGTTITYTVFCKVDE